jgi:pilus assembly protein FimV
MQKILSKLIFLSAATALSSLIYATNLGLDMGPMKVSSEYGERLNASVQLMNISQDEANKISAIIVSPDVYKKFNTEYPYGNNFSFRVENDVNGNPYLKIATAEPVNHASVTLLLQIIWPSGMVSRRYSFAFTPANPIITPPGTEKAVLKEAETAIGNAMTEKQGLNNQSAQIATVNEQPNLNKALSDEIKTDNLTSSNKITNNFDIGSHSQAENNDSVKINSGDTISKIASENNPGNVNLARLIVAIYRKNAEKFDGKNMNRMHVGKVLQMPTDSDIYKIAKGDADREIQAQNKEWESYQKELVGSASRIDENSDQDKPKTTQSASGKITMKVEDKVIASEAVNGVLKVSKGDAPKEDSKVSAGGKEAKAAKVNAVQENVIVNNKQTGEENKRITLLEENIRNMEKLKQAKIEVEILTKAIQSASAVNAINEIKVASAVSAASSVDSLKPAVNHFSAKPDAGTNWKLIGPVILVALGGLGWFIRKRKKAGFFKFKFKK